MIWAKNHRFATFLNRYVLSDSIVLIPTYNEKENIAKILGVIFALEQDFHVLVIDDGSPDGTGEIVRQLQGQPEFSGRLFLEERAGKQGLGTAYIHGFRWALARDYEYIFEMDADFSHAPSDLPRLYAAMQGRPRLGVAIGSRYISGGKLENWPWSRILISRGASFYVRLVTWLPVSDSTAGFVCYRRSFLQALDFDQIRFIGYAFQIEMKFAAWQLGFDLVEVPITFVDRKEGTSKMSTAIFNEAFIGVLKMRWRAWTQREVYRKKD